MEVLSTSNILSFDLLGDYFLNIPAFPYNFQNFVSTFCVLYPICSHSFYNVLVYLNFYMGFDNIVILSIVIIICVLVLCRKILIKKLTS